MTTAVHKPPAPKMPVSDIAVKAKTGHSWAQWCKLLDREKAEAMSHREVVALLNTKFGVSPWWQQMVTVGYERARGRRVVNQTTQGFSTSVSRTIGAPAAAAFKAWGEGAARTTWLPAQRFTVDTAIASKSLRVTWPDDTKVEVRITARGPSKCVIEVTHAGLAGAAAVRGTKSYWGTRLDALRDVLEG